MSFDHTSPEELQAFVDGSADPATCAKVSGHVRACAECAQKLGAAARLEEQLHEVVTAQPVRSTRVPVAARRAARVILPLALAASVIYVVAFRAPPKPSAVLAAAPSDGIPAVLCPDGPDQRECVSTAHARGLIVSYPATQSAPTIGAAPLKVSEWSFE